MKSLALICDLKNEWLLFLLTFLLAYYTVHCNKKYGTFIFKRKDIAHESISHIVMSKLHAHSPIAQ